MISIAIALALGVLLMVYRFAGVSDIASEAVCLHMRMIGESAGGLLAEFGRQWVCWGDLRTEYVQSGELKARLKAQQ